MLLNGNERVYMCAKQNYVPPGEKKDGKGLRKRGLEVGLSLIYYTTPIQRHTHIRIDTHLPSGISPTERQSGEVLP